MKKNLEKIFASASIIVAIILIMVLIVTAFGGIEFKEFESALVRGLLITLAILYLVLACVALVLMFVNRDIIKDVVIRTETGGSVRVSSTVINRLVKKACAEIEGLKCKKVVLVQDDYGVRLKINVKIVDKDVVEVETYLRTLLTDMFFGEFGFKFESIEIKVMVLTPKYKSDKQAIEAIVAEKVAEIRADQPAAVEEIKKAAQEETTPVVNETADSQPDIDGNIE
ncbi:MAG: alkaline shock response membrane anchor protein AmaP [Bacteroides sp.]|nr:alkaline shock response membrane anchor protein AmaP [Bacillota bacterium]MCM1393305.1 alkaline shock response membrane anchor protein AmaP [[Eubacterium] siraeum]MCM1455725.1 alkaline shock response membrane anchor protein AmaP [Bacteroides sp.]